MLVHPINLVAFLLVIIHTVIDSVNTLGAFQIITEERKIRLKPNQNEINIVESEGCHLHVVMMSVNLQLLIQDKEQYDSHVKEVLNHHNSNSHVDT